MASSVYYKFKAQKEESRVTFDGTGISVFDLKREIMITNKMGKGADFDLAIYDSKSDKEYVNDNELIPRSTLVIVRRLPPSKPGKGRAQNYLAGLPSVNVNADSRIEQSKQDRTQRTLAAGPWKPGFGSISKRFDGKDVPLPKPKPAIVATETREGTKPEPAKDSSVDADEEAAIAAMLQQTSEQWQKTQEKMSQATPVYTHRHANGFRKPFQPPQQRPQFEQPQRPPPAGYTCYRCGQKGHWIHDCPTNGDQEFDNKPRIKRTTGIPRSFLKPVENPISSGSAVHGVMVTPEGGYVIAEPDSASWEKQRAKTKALTENDLRERPSTEPALACPLCSRLYREAVKTPCCLTTYCEECVQAHLLERDFTCPNCEKKVGSLDKLVPDRESRIRVKEYIQKAIDASKDDVPTNGTVSNVASEQPSHVGTPEPDNYQGSFAEVPDYSAEIAALQGSMRQIVSMLGNPNITPQNRLHLQMQMQQTSAQMSQLQAMASMADMNVMGGMNGMGMMNGFNGMEAMQMNGMMMNGMPMNGMAMGGYDPGFNAMAWQQGGYGGDWSNYPNQQAGMGDAPYQRPPVNNRFTNRGVKRERPQDLVDVDPRSEKVARHSWQ